MKSMLSAEKKVFHTFPFGKIGKIGRVVRECERVNNAPLNEQNHTKMIL